MLQGCQKSLGVTVKITPITCNAQGGCLLTRRPYCSDVQCHTAVILGDPYCVPYTTVLYCVPNGNTKTNLLDAYLGPRSRERTMPSLPSLSAYTLAVGFLCAFDSHYLVNSNYICLASRHPLPPSGPTCGPSHTPFATGHPGHKLSHKSILVASSLSPKQEKRVSSEW